MLVGVYCLMLLIPICTYNWTLLYKNKVYDNWKVMDSETFVLTIISTLLGLNILSILGSLIVSGTQSWRMLLALLLLDGFSIFMLKQFTAFMNEVVVRDIKEDETLAGLRKNNKIHRTTTPVISLLVLLFLVITQNLSYTVCGIMALPLLLVVLSTAGTKKDTAILQNYTLVSEKVLKQRLTNYYEKIDKKIIYNTDKKTKLGKRVEEARKENNFFKSVVLAWFGIKSKKKVEIPKNLKEGKQ